MGRRLLNWWHSSGGGTVPTDTVPSRSLLPLVTLSQSRVTISQI